MDNFDLRRHGRLTFQPERRRLLVDGAPAKIGAHAFDLLTALIERRDRVVSKDELLELVWPGVVVEEANLHVQIATLRKLVGSATIATIPGRGYQFVATEATTPEAPPASTLVAPVPTDAASRGFGIDRRWRSAAVALVLALAGGVAGMAALTHADAPVFAAAPFVAMSSDALSAQLAAGVTAEIAADLGHNRSLRLIAVPGADGRTPAQSRQIARDFKADFVLTGAARREGDKIEIGATLTDGATGETLWSNLWRAKVQDDLVAFQAQAAGDVAFVLGPRAFLVTRGPQPVLAARSGRGS